MLKEAFVKNLKLYIEMRGYTTMAAFAEEIGVTKSLVSKWFAKKAFPSEQIIERICKVLGITPALLFATEAEGISPSDKGVCNGGCDSSISTDELIQHFQLYLSLSSEGRKRVLDYMKEILVTYGKFDRRRSHE